MKVSRCIRKLTSVFLLFCMILCLCPSFDMKTAAIEINNNKYYYIRNRYSGKYLDVANNATANGTNVQQYEYGNYPSERWHITYSGGYYTLRSTLISSPSMVLDGRANCVAGAQVVIYEKMDCPEQLWTLVPQSNGTYRIKPKANPSLSLSVSGPSTSNNALVKLETTNSSASQQEWYLEEVMNLNTRISTTISKAGEVDYFNFKPTDTGLYTVETFGSLDTTLTFKQYSWSTLTDDDTGVGSNAKIGFSVTNANLPCVFEVRGYGSKTGLYQLQVRRQKMAIFVGDYSDADTRPEADVPAAQMGADGYYVWKHINGNRTLALSNDYTGVPTMNSEIFFFNGHAGANYIEFPDGSYIVNSEVPSMDRTKLAVLAGCNTANDANGTSIAKKICEKGAIVSIGWSTLLPVPSSPTFTNTFFEEIKKDRTVQQACETAASKLLWPFDNGKNYKIYGPPNYILLSQVTPNTQSAQYQQSNVSEQQFMEDIENHAYYVEEISDTLTRYIKEIDGVITNDFYDVYHTESSPVIIKSQNTISAEDESQMLAQAQALRVRAVNNAEEQLPEKEGYTIVGTEVHHMIHKCDNDMMPITITEITYQDEEGFCLLDYHCVDKRNGNVIDYAHIGIAE